MAGLILKREVCIPLANTNCPYTEEDPGLQAPTASLVCSWTWYILAPIRVLQEGACNLMTEDLPVHTYLLSLDVPQWLDNRGDGPMNCTHYIGIR
jgi:hypothetical protein